MLTEPEHSFCKFTTLNITGMQQAGKVLIIIGIILVICLGFFGSTSAQTKKPLTIDDLNSWNRITESAISWDGSLAGFVIEPWDGDPIIKLYDSTAAEKVSFSNASGLTLTTDSRYLIFTIRTPEAKVKELKLKKTKKEDMPLNSLGIYNVIKNTTDTIERLKSYKVPSKWAGWIAYQCEPEKKAEPSKANGLSEADMTSGKASDSKPKAESEANGYNLYLRTLAEGTTDTIKFVTGYVFAEEEPVLLCATTGDGKDDEPGVIVINLKKDRHQTLYRGKGKYKQLTLSKDGERAAFIVSSDEKDKAGNTFSLFWWKGSGNALLAANRGTPGIPEGWIINENARLIFGEKSNRLFFGTSPEYKLKDTIIPDEDRPNVDVWHYAEGKLHTLQVIDKQRDIKKSYVAVFHCDKKKVVQLSTPEMPDIQLIDNGDAPKVLTMSNLPYELETMWEGSPWRYDIWLVDIMTGSAQKLKENYRALIRPSPAGKYLYWYHSIDSSWYTYDIAAGREYRLTTPASLPCYDELNDVPNVPQSYPPAGWLKDDKAFLISDRYDIWSLDPAAGNPPVNVTINGRNSRISYRLMDLDYENDFIDPSVSTISEWFQ